MKPIKDKVFAELIEDQKTLNSGIYVGEDLLNSNRALVVSVGTKVKHVKPGDKIKFINGSGFRYEHEGKKCIFLKESSEIEGVL